MNICAKKGIKATDYAAIETLKLYIRTAKTKSLFSRIYTWYYTQTTEIQGKEVFYDS